jgi:pimeloyl-ACP methyl ester carboxylesterase
MDERFAEANGITLCYETFGRPDKPALVLIMGMGAQMVGWEAGFCQALAARGFRVIRFDHRDVGKSSRLSQLGVPDVSSALTRAWLGKPVLAPYVLREMAMDVIGLLDALGIPAAHVVGASMGGAIAQLLAMQFPRRVLSLTSIMSTTGAPDLPQPQPRALRTVMQPPPTELSAYVEYYVAAWRTLRVHYTAEDQRLDRMRAILNHQRGLHPEGGARHLLAILASGSRRRALHAVSTPTLVIHGDVDPLVPLEGGVDTANSIAGARLMVLKDMGHALPEAMWPAIVDAVAAHAQ